MQALMLNLFGDSQKFCRTAFVAVFVLFIQFAFDAGGIVGFFFGTLLGFVFSPSLAAEVILAILSFLWLVDIVDWFRTFPNFLNQHFGSLDALIVSVFASVVVLFVWFGLDGLSFGVTPSLFGQMILAVWLFGHASSAIRWLGQEIFGS